MMVAVGQSDNDRFAALSATRRAERARALDEAKRRDHAEGKEPFDLDRFEADYRGHPYRDPDRAHRLEEFENEYYLGHPHLGRIGELVVYLEILDEGNSPSAGNGAAAIADRASKLAYRDDVPSLKEAIHCYERLLALIPEGRDVVPPAQLDSIYSQRWLAMAPHRFRRKDILAALEHARARVKAS